MTDISTKQYGNVQYPNWFLDKQQDYIANVVSQAYDLGHTSNSNQAKKFLHDHLNSRFGGNWQIRIVPISEHKVYTDAKAATQNGEPFYVFVQLNETSYTMWKSQ